MATKREKTSFNQSQNLKTAMEADGLTFQMSDGMAFYDDAANDQHLCIGQWDDGSFRTVNLTGGTVSFDFIEPSDPLLVRMWTERELALLVGLYPGIEGNDTVFDDVTQKWICTITHNGGQTKTGTDANKPDAIAKAFVKVLEL